MSHRSGLPAALDLSGRVALVTGAGSPSGIGFATARLLGSLGAAVAVTATPDRVHDRVEGQRGSALAFPEDAEATREPVAQREPRVGVGCDGKADGSGGARHPS